MTGRAEAVGRIRVADVPELRLGARRRRCDDVGTERFRAKSRVGVGFGPAEPVLHVKRRHVVAERAQRVPQAGRVGAAGDEAENVTAGRDQLVPADVHLDARAQRAHVH